MKSFHFPGLIFFINAKQDDMSIVSSWTTGDRVSTLIDSDIYEPTSLAIDYRAGGRLFWSDFTRGTVESVMPDGSDRAIVAYMDEDERPFHVDVFAECVFMLHAFTCLVHVVNY